ncbi:MAG: asparaginase, partial [Ruminococcus sp.]|nr:asparaginase [Ruminococcus sp.]
MNILIFATGGTIGSSFDGESINVRADGGCAVIDRYQAEHSDVRFDILHPLNLLSERISAADFTTLAKAIEKADVSRYDGVIFTVG